jgi:hypothetical protein
VQVVLRQQLQQQAVEALLETALTLTAGTAYTATVGAGGARCGSSR